MKIIIAAFFNRLVLTLPRIDLGVQLGVPYEIDDPSLCLLWGHVQFIGQHTYAYTLMNSAKRLEYHQPEN